MNTIFVEASLEEQIQEFVIYVAKLKGEPEEGSTYVSDIKSQIDAGSTESVIVKITEESGILLEAPDREIEGTYNLLISIIQSAPISSLSALIDNLVGPIIRDTGDKYIIKQKVLSNLYNTLPFDSPLRYNVFKSIVEVAANHDEIETIVPDLTYLEGWIKNWGVGKEKERDLYLFASDQLSRCGEERQAFTFLLKHLSTYDDTSDLTSTTAMAERAVVTAIKMDNFFSFEDLLHIKAIAALHNRSNYYKLLLVFLNENLIGYQKFAEANSDLISGAGLSEENNVRKMRLLSLASLGSENLSRELTYAQVATALQIPEDEVEMWVIDVIRAGLVEAKLNQLTHTIIVHRSIIRVFGREEWKQLSDKLNSWKQSLTEILAVVGNAKLIANSQGVGGGVAEVTVQTSTVVEINGQ